MLKYLIFILFGIILYILLNNCETFSIGLDKYIYAEKLHQDDIDAGGEEYIQDLIADGYTILQDKNDIKYTVYNYISLETKDLILYNTIDDAYKALKEQSIKGKFSLKDYEILSHHPDGDGNHISVTPDKMREDKEDPESLTDPAPDPAPAPAPAPVSASAMESYASLPRPTPIRFIPAQDNPAADPLLELGIANSAYIEDEDWIDSKERQLYLDELYGPDGKPELIGESDLNV